MNNRSIPPRNENRAISSNEALQFLVGNATHRAHRQEQDSPEEHSPTEVLSKVSRDDFVVLARAQIANKPDPFQLADKLLEYVVQQIRTQKEFDNLIQLLEPSPALASTPTIRLIAFCQLARSASRITDHLAGVSLGYSQVLECLLANKATLRSSVYVSLCTHFVKMCVEAKPWMKALDLYCMLLAAESQCADERTLALDLFSEALEAVIEYTEVCNLDETHSIVCELISSAISNRKDASECLKAVLLLQPRRSIESKLPITESYRFLRDLIQNSRSPRDDIVGAAYWHHRLSQRDPAGVATELYEAATIHVGNTSDRPDSRTQRLGSLIETMLDESVDSSRLQSLTTSILRGDFHNTDEVIVAIQRICDMAQIETVASTDVLTRSEMHRVDQLQTKRGSQLVSVALLRMRLDRWQQLSDIHRGFTSWLVAAKRGPFREPPDLVQFAIDAGDETSVRYLNAKDPNAFPGKGYFFTRLRTERCFAPQPPSVSRARSGIRTYDPFHVYKTAWPDLAEAFDHFPKAEFIFLRGFVLVSCKHRDFLLPNSKGEHYSLVIFNDHFRNPFQEVAYLVPNRGIASLFARTQIPYADYVGFDARRPDINDVLGSPQAFLSHDSIKSHAIDVGSVSAILNGFSSHNLRLAEEMGQRTLAAGYSEIESRITQYNEEVREWESRSHLYHMSPSGLMAMMQLSKKGHALEKEQAELVNSHAALEDAIEQNIWQLVDRYISLHRLFHIAHAYWHRGFTAGRPVATQLVSESSDWLDSGPSMQPQNELKFEKSEDSISNRNSIRMLVQAYEWHSMRENLNAKRDDFPILVKCDALQLGSQPEIDWYLDTFDMTAVVQGQTVALTQRRMTGDDELFWLSHLFPLVQDEPGRIVDLRFYPRSSLGIN